MIATHFEPFLAQHGYHRHMFRFVRRFPSGQAVISFRHGLYWGRDRGAFAVELGYRWDVVRVLLDQRWRKARPDTPDCHFRCFLGEVTPVREWPHWEIVFGEEPTAAVSGVQCLLTDTGLPLLEEASKPELAVQNQLILRRVDSKHDRALLQLLYE